MLARVTGAQPHVGAMMGRHQLLQLLPHVPSPTYHPAMPLCAHTCSARLYSSGATFATDLNLGWLCGGGRAAERTGATGQRPNAQLNGCRTTLSASC